MTSDSSLPDYHTLFTKYGKKIEYFQQSTTIVTIDTKMQAALETCDVSTIQQCHEKVCLPTNALDIVCTAYSKRLGDLPARSAVMWVCRLKNIHYLDAACKVGEYDWIHEIITSIPKKNLKRYVKYCHLSDLAYCGCMDGFELILSVFGGIKNVPGNSNIFTRAVAGGHVDMIRLLADLDCSWDYSTWSSGSIMTKEVCDLLIELDVPINIKAFSYIGKNPDMAVFDTLYRYFCEKYPNEVTKLISYISTELPVIVVKHLVSDLGIVVVGDVLQHRISHE